MHFAIAININHNIYQNTLLFLFVFIIATSIYTVYHINCTVGFYSIFLITLQSKEEAEDVLERGQFNDVYGKHRLFPSVQDAVLHAQCGLRLVCWHGIGSEKNYFTT